MFCKLLTEVNGIGSYEFHRRQFQRAGKKRGCHPELVEGLCSMPHKAFRQAQPDNLNLQIRDNLFPVCILFRPVNQSLPL